MDQRIADAHRLLKLPDEFSINRLNEAYRAILHERHPDHSSVDHEKRTAETREIIEAYRLLLAYCYSVPVSISRDFFEKDYRDPEEFWKNHFGSDPLWGGPEK